MYIHAGFPKRSEWIVGGSEKAPGQQPLDSTRLRVMLREISAHRTSVMRKSQLEASSAWN